MYLTESEILDTPKALEKTCGYFDENEKRIDEFFEKYPLRKFTFLGCGSSYMLSESAATLFSSVRNTAARAIPAGDYIVDPDFWYETVKDSVVVTLSRSGRTSEVVWAVEKIKETAGCPIISVCAKEENDLTALSDLELMLPWCYDESVCQTRTVTNLYAASLLLLSRYSKNEGLKKAARAACAQSGKFQLKYRDTLAKIADMDWDNAVVLADGPVCGIAAEASLAFTEISMLTGRYFHMLDYRHGPVVVSGKRTLTLILLRPGEERLQGAMVRDVIRRGGPVVTVSERAENVYGAASHLQIENVGDFSAWGILFIYVAQMTALLKSVALGGNPDAPEGLDAYIELK